MQTVSQLVSRMEGRQACWRRRRWWWDGNRKTAYGVQKRHQTQNIVNEFSVYFRPYITVFHYNVSLPLIHGIIILYPASHLLTIRSLRFDADGPTNRKTKESDYMNELLYPNFMLSFLSQMKAGKRKRMIFALRNKFWD